MKKSIILVSLSLLVAFNLYMSQADEPETSVGTAEMMPDRSIVLMLRTQSADGAIGEARFVYSVDSRDYQAVLDHLGGLEPAQSKSVPPWPESSRLPGGS